MAPFWSGKSKSGESKDAFTTVPFAIDGEMIGLATWRLADLSPRWLSACQQLLEENGPSFRVSLGQTLDHLEINLTSADGGRPFSAPDFSAFPASNESRRVQWANAEIASQPRIALGRASRLNVRASLDAAKSQFPNSKSSSGHLPQIAESTLHRRSELG